MCINMLYTSYHHIHELIWAWCWFISAWTTPRLFIYCFQLWIYKSFAGWSDELGWEVWAAAEVRCANTQRAAWRWSCPSLFGVRDFAAQNKSQPFWIPTRFTGTRYNFPFQPEYEMTRVLKPDKWHIYEQNWLPAHCFIRFIIFAFFKRAALATWSCAALSF